MKYPQISWNIDHDELLDHFTLSAKERNLLTQWRKEANILGFAVVLKSFVFLGFPPRNKENIPASVVSWVSDQLDLDAGLLREYRWKDENVWDTHLAAIRTIHRIPSMQRERCAGACPVACVSSRKTLSVRIYSGAILFKGNLYWVKTQLCSNWA